MTALFVWFAFIAVEVWRNYHIIEVEKQKPNYLMSFTIRAMVAIGHGILMGVIDPATWWPVLIFQVSSFWILFDLGLNIKRGKHPLYYNRSGWIEKTVGRIEFLYYLLKLIVLIAMISTLTLLIV